MSLDGAYRILVGLSEVNGRITGEELGEQINLSISAIESYSRPLREKGIILGYKGSGGGYQLARPLNQITLDEFFSCVKQPSIMLSRLIKKSGAKMLSDL